MTNKERKPNKVYEGIKEAILYMKIKPGESIGEIDVANYFNVSRTPVRDAFKKLEADGLVEIKSHIGTFVSLIDLEHIVDTIFMREHIEKAIIRSLAENPQPSHYLKLSYVLDSQKQLLDGSLTGQEMAAKFMELDNVKSVEPQMNFTLSMITGKYEAEDVSIIGIDDILISRYIEPKLTTIGIDKAGMGTLAMDMIIQKIKGKNAESILLPMELIERDSVKTKK